MTRIVGLQGLFNPNNLNLMLNSLKYTNISKNFTSGIFLSIDNNIIHNNKLCNINSLIFNNINRDINGDNSTDNTITNNNNINKNSNIGLGSIFSINQKNSPQPVRYKKLILVFDGTIYNSSDIIEFLNVNNYNYVNNDFNIYDKDYIEDDLLVAKLLWNYFNEFLDLKKAIFKVNELLDGEYAFTVFDGENLAISRDKLGIKPIYYYLDDDYYNLVNSSNSSNFSNFTDDPNSSNYFHSSISFNSFASEKKALWKLGIDDSDILSLVPGHVLYNWELFSPKNNPWDNEYDITKFIDKSINQYSNKSTNKLINKPAKITNYNINNMNYSQIKNELLKLLSDSIYKRVKNLDEVGLIFSGGVDSTILANLLKKEHDELNVNLYTVGAESSKDLIYSRKIAKQLNIPLETIVIDENIVKENLIPVLEAVEEPNLMKIGVGMTLYLATKRASEDHFSVVLSGQGADELFGGYNRYLNTFKENGPKSVEIDLINDIKHAYKVNFERDDKIANSNGVELRIPYLDETLVNFSFKIPILYKIQSSEDKLRKRILRDIALDIGLDEEITMRPKKAAQYGSGIHKILIKKVLKAIDLDYEMNKIINY